MLLAHFVMAIDTKPNITKHATPAMNIPPNRRMGATQDFTGSGARSPKRTFHRTGLLAKNRSPGESMKSRDA
jgi:hypothetical protein